MPIIGPTEERPNQDARRLIPLIRTKMKVRKTFADVSVEIFNYFHSDFCSHRRAWHFYAESVTRTESNAFQAIPCKAWTQFVHQKCKAGKTAFQMGFHAQAGSDGNFYLQTNSQPAFSRDALGVCYSSKDKQY